jgi:hypothetical protein
MREVVVALEEMCSVKCPFTASTKARDCAELSRILNRVWEMASGAIVLSKSARTDF